MHGVWTRFGVKAHHEPERNRCRQLSPAETVGDSGCRESLSTVCGWLLAYLVELGKLYVNGHTTTEALAKLLADSGTNVQGLVQTGHWGQGIGDEAPIHEETQARLGIGRGSGRRCRLLR